MGVKESPRYGVVDGLLNRRGWRNARCLYILSTGRTGTTSLEKLFKLVPGMAVYHELPPFNVTTTIEALHHVHEDPERFARYFRKHRAGIIGSHHRRGEVFVETNNFKYLSPVIADLLPGARFVHLYRHPADYVRSGMRRNWYVSHPWDSFRLRPAEDDPWYTAWQDWPPFHKICWFWKTANQTFLNFMKTQPESRVASVKFEELFDGKSSVYERFFHIIGVEPPAEPLARECLATPFNAQHDGDFPRYSEWSRSQKDTLREIAGDVMNELGYE
jgi:hypothetical protein